jgi:hypothetical protein
MLPFWLILFQEMEFSELLIKKEIYFKIILKLCPTISNLLRKEIQQDSI